MEDETQVSSEIPVKIEAGEKADPIDIRNGDLPHKQKEGKKEDDETDGEFIKVEKESLDVKEGSHAANAASAGDEQTLTVERSLSSSSRDLLEAQEKIKELELELEKVAGVLKHSESENAKLNNEVSLAKERLEESGKKYEQLEASHRKLQEQTIETEEKYSLQLNTLQEALQAQEGKHKELTEVKEAFDGLSLELENSKKRMQELEHELQFSAGEAKKFEELHKQSGSHAESETQRALEFERLLEVAKKSAKETEDQITSLQDEVKGLYDKIAENQKVEEALKSTIAELSNAKEELALSKAQVLDVEQRLSSKEARMDELVQELDLKKASEFQVKEDVSALETLLATTKDDLQAKISELEGIKLKLQEEINARESAESGLKTKEAQALTVQAELAKVVEEKEVLEATVAELTSNATHMKEQCIELEEKLKLSDENFSKVDSLLSQALANSAELEQKLKSVEDLHNESGVAVATATQKNVELEDLIRASNEEAEKAKSELRELESRFIVSEQRNVELEQQLNLVELKSSDSEREVSELSEKFSRLSSTLKEVEEAKKELIGQMQEYKEKITNLESALDQSSSRNLELETELKLALEKCTDHETRANMNHERSKELEDLFQKSHSKAEDAGKKANELELLLEAEKYRIQELEEQIGVLEKKCVDAEADQKKYSDKVSELTSELEAYQARASSLETALQAANDKERELAECLNSVTDEKKRLEDESSNSSSKLAEAENLVEVLRKELSVMQEKFENIENDLKATGLRESDVVLKLRLVEEQLEQQGKLLEHATARHSELESIHETLTRDSETKIQEAIANFSNKDMEAKSLSEKLKILEEKVKLYEEQLAEAAGKSASLKEELDFSLLRMASLETSNEELKTQILEAENKVSNSFSENELLVETNNQLKIKVDELQDILNSAISAKESTAHQLASHMTTITEITDKHSRAVELHSATEARMTRAEAELQEAFQVVAQRDTEMKVLNEKLNAFEGEVKLYEEQKREASAVAETQKLELEETLLKLKHLENVVEELHAKSGHFERESGGLAEANLKLTQELASYESKLSELEAKLSSAHSEKDEAFEQVHSSKKAIEDLTQQLTDEGQRLQTQISSVMEENNLLNDTYQNAKKELQSVIVQLEEQLKEQKPNEDTLRLEIENLRANVAQKSALQGRVEDLEKELVKAEARLKEEVESIQATATRREAELTLKLEDHAQKVHDRDLLNDQVLQLQKELQLAQTTISQQKEAESHKELERETALKKSLEDLEAKNKEVELLEKQVKELEQKLQVLDSKLLEKGDGGNTLEHKDGVEIKSRDIGLAISTPSKRKSKKKLEAASAQTSSLVETHTQTAEASPATTFKFILGVALVSIIIGVFLGKRY